MTGRWIRVGGSAVQIQTGGATGGAPGGGVTGGLPAVTSGTLLGYWPASSITGLSDGATVTSWPDASGNGRDLAAVGAPTYQTGELNGAPCVRFPDSPASYCATDAINQVQPVTLFVLARKAAPEGGGFTVMVGAGPLSDLNMYLNTGQRMQVWAGGNNGQTGVLDLTAVHLFEAVINNTASSLGVDGVLTAAELGGNNLVGFTVAAYYSRSGAFYVGDIFSVAAYAGALSPADRALVRAALTPAEGGAGFGVTPFGTGPFGG